MLAPCATLARGLAILGVLCATTLQAAQPEVRDVAPTGVVRGEPTVVTLSGARLQDVRQILFEKPGIAATDLKPVDNNKFEVTFAADPDLAPGLYPFRVVTETGVSNLRLLSVGALPVVAEVEPNSEFASPQKIGMNVTVTGVVTREDEDYFAIDLKQGERICCEIEGVRLSYYPRNGSDFFDPYIAILDSERFEKVTSDDASLLLQDALCAFVAPEDGTYVIVVRDSSFGGNDDANYRLHVGNFPRPVSIVPAGGRPGETIDAQVVDADGSISNSQIKLPDLSSFEYPVSIGGPEGIAPSPNVVRVLPMPVVVEQEPNDSITEPNTTTEPLPLAFCGTIATEGDQDSFAFEAKQGQKVVTRLFARSLLRSPLDAVTDIYDAANNRVGGNDDSGGPDSFAEFNVPADGVYTIRVRDHLAGGEPNYSYRLEVEVAQPELTLSLPEERRDETMDISIPRGSQIAVMVNAARRNFGGDLEFMLENLPAGVTATTFPMPANQSTIPLLLSAAADAEMNATRVDIAARLVAENSNVTGHLLQRHKLVSGQNRVDVWGVDSDRAAVAVTKEAPVSIELVQPTTPIVRNGSAGLKVIAHRTEGFTDEIPVRFLYVSPGLSTNNSLKINKDETEVTIPLTANKNAQTGTWPMIVTAYANVGNGSIKLSSMPVELTVEDVFFNFKFNKTSAEQGAKTQVLVGVEVAREFAGTAEVTLVGLPAGVTSPQPTQPITAETTEVVFPIEIAPDARPGNHKTLVCQAVVHSPGGDIQQQGDGTAELQIDVPLPAPAAAPAAEAMPAEPAPQAEAPPKPLSRIEQLRLEREKKKNN
jgi:hypothetical protein